MSRFVARGLTALALGGLTTFGLATPAFAATCPAGTYGATSTGCTPVTLTVTQVIDGQPFTVTLDGFGNVVSVVAQIHSTAVTLGTFTTNSQGSVTMTLTVPKGFPAGNHILTFSGTAPDGSARILEASITVKASGLPFTGAEIGVVSLVSVSLLGAGTLAVIAGRRRKLEAPAETSVPA